MNAARIVDFLLEGDLTPEEFFASNPELLADYEFTPYSRYGYFEVKRWVSGMYNYLGSVVYTQGAWYPYEVAPGLNRSHKHIVSPGAGSYKTREEAAKVLWELYRKEGQ